MIDLFAVISLGGLVHWTYKSYKFDHLTIINTVLLFLSTSSNDLNDLEELTVGPNLVKWIINEDLNLIYLLAHPKMFPIDWCKSLLNRIDNLIISKEYSEALKMDPFLQLNEEFSLLFKEALKREELQKQNNKNNTKKKNPNKKEKELEVRVQRRSWNDKATKSEMESLDFSLKNNIENLNNSEQEIEQSNNLKNQNLLQFKTDKSLIDELSDTESSNSSDNESEDNKSTSTSKNKSNTWWNSLKSLTGNNPLKLEDCKSTNLSKVAYWLLQHDLKVLMVAGDTFRAGAIEQLRQHSRNLGSMAPGRIEIYERGYGRDAALVTKEAIKYANDKKFDVVLVDTAGRMQDNGPLMIALAKLISLNRPDRVIFVGEALVGHDALAQLSKFNAALLDHSAKPIDGILLTKVDTIDDKIGAALSMTLQAKAPILFVGVGQTYLDLKRINVKQVVDLLLK